MIYDTQGAAMHFEVNHGPILIDNNIIEGRIRNWSDSVVFVHNLLLNHRVEFRTNDTRSTSFYEPHTSISAGRQRATGRDHKAYNNIVTGVVGLSNYTDALNGFGSDYNLLLRNANPSTQDENSFSTPYDPDVSLESDADGVDLIINVASQLGLVACPVIDRDFFGTFRPTNQGLENHDGSPITINRDFFGAVRSDDSPTVGPFESVDSGSVRLRLFSRAVETSPPTVTLSSSTETIDEASGAATLTATLSAAWEEVVIVRLGFGGTATGHGTDYRRTTRIEIPAGATSGTAVVTAVDDDLVEGDETVIVNITSVTNATEDGVQQQTITITDNDIATPDDSRSITIKSGNATGNFITNVSAFQTRDLRYSNTGTIHVIDGTGDDDDGLAIGENTLCDFSKTIIIIPDGVTGDG